ncbi:hypothetical protein SCLCIDRAFT_1225084 [Scleroderma citrinum Foug A]|uniref:Uncharacterized protein n=1 Tax=Scleroderma citrinum Foug A TaxID=1036808 RepID=A0A0C3D328_9AGAM|nr:hypothetical protein SCLCIDRAFT_1225084 [Scleroderma citrinum Foug A]
MLESVHVTATTISRPGNGMAAHLQKLNCYLSRNGRMKKGAPDGKAVVLSIEGNFHVQQNPRTHQQTPAN